MIDNRKPTLADIHIGHRIRIARKQARMSQADLAGHVERLSPQAIQIWEGAETRISAGRLWEISKATRQPISFFFAEMPTYLSAATPRLSPPTSAALTRTAQSKPTPQPHSQYT